MRAGRAVLVLAAVGLPCAALATPQYTWPPLPASMLPGDPVRDPYVAPPWLLTARQQLCRPQLTRGLGPPGTVLPGGERIALAEAVRLAQAGEAVASERFGALAAAALDPAIARTALRLRAEHQARTGQASAAAAAFERYLAQRPAGESQAWRAQLWAAWARYAAEDAPAALALLQEALSETARDAGEHLTIPIERSRERLLAQRLAGWLLAQAGDWDAARTHWRQALAQCRHPALCDSIRFDLAEAHFVAGEWDSVRVLLSATARDGTIRRTPRASFLLARSQLELGARAEADSLYAALLGEAPETLPALWRDEALLVRGWLALQRGAAEAARASYRAVSGEHGGDVALQRYGEALAEIAAGRHRAAGELLAPAPPVAPEDSLYAPWCYALGFARFQEGAYRDALLALEWMRGRVAADSLALASGSLRGDAYYRLGEMEAAYAVYAKTAALLPEVPEALQRRQALAAMGAQRWGTAARLFGDLILRFPGTRHAAEYHFWRAEAFYRLGRVAEAREHYRRAERAGADALRCAYALAWCDYEERRYEEAHAGFVRAAALCDGCRLAADIALRRGNCLFNLGRLEAARDAFAVAKQQAARDSLGPLEGEAAFRHAWALLRLEDYRAARIEFARLHAAAGRTERAARALYWEGQAALREGDYPAAVERFTLLETHPAADDSLRSGGRLAAGDALYNAGDWGAAIEWYRRTLESPGATRAQRRSAHESLFECRHLRGELAAARQVLADLEAQFPEATAGGERYLLLADDFFAERRYAEALSAYGDYLERAAVDDPRVADVQFRAARSREALGQKKEAAHAYLALGERSGFRRRAAALQRAGVLLLELEEARAALRAFEARLALDLSPAQTTLTRAYLAQTYEALEEPLAARNEWEKVAHAGGGVSDSLRAIGNLHLGRIAFDLEEWQAAYRAFRAADSLGAAGPVYRAPYWEGEAAYRAGRTGAAIEALERFLQRGEREVLWEATARMRLAECHEAEEAWQAAVEQYAEVLRLPLSGSTLREEAAARQAELAARRRAAPPDSNAAEGSPPSGSAPAEEGP